MQIDLQARSRKVRKLSAVGFMMVTTHIHVSSNGVSSLFGAHKATRKKGARQSESRSVSINLLCSLKVSTSLAAKAWLYSLGLLVPRRRRLGLVSNIDGRDEEEAAEAVCLCDAALLNSIKDLDGAVLIDSLGALGSSLSSCTCAEENDIGRVLVKQRGDVRDRRLLERSNHRLN